MVKSIIKRTLYFELGVHGMGAKPNDRHLSNASVPLGAKARWRDVVRGMTIAIVGTHGQRMQP